MEESAIHLLDPLALNGERITRENSGFRRCGQARSYVRTGVRQPLCEALPPPHHDGLG